MISITVPVGERSRLRIDIKTEIHGDPKDLILVSWSNFHKNNLPLSSSFSRSFYPTIFTELEKHQKSCTIFFFTMILYKRMPNETNVSPLESVLTSAIRKTRGQKFFKLFKNRCLEQTFEFGQFRSTACSIKRPPLVSSNTPRLARASSLLNKFPETELN